MSRLASSKRGERAGLLASATLLAALAACASAPPPPEADEGALPEATFDISGDRLPTVKTLMTMAHILAKNGNDPQCEVVLLKVVDAHPDYAPAYNELAELYMRQDRSEEAAAVLKLGVAAMPADSVLWNNLGMVHLMREEFEEARESFTRACAVAPLDSRPRANLAVALGMSGRLEEAEAVYLQATTKSKAYHDLAVLCEARGDAANAALYRGLAEGKRRPPPDEVPEK